MVTREFLAAVLGQEAADALLKSTDRGTIALQDAVSRAALAWAREALAGHRAGVPGNPSLRLLAKGEAWTLRGAGEEPLGGFGHAQLAAVALHLWGLAPALPHGAPGALAQLGRALDGLAKAARRDLAGPSAAPTAPKAPAAPVPAQPTQTAPRATAGRTPQLKPPAPPAAAGAAPSPAAKAGPKLPRVKKARTAVFGKAELARPCGTCAAGDVASCSCWGTLGKSLGFADRPDGRVTVTFGAGWDGEAMLAWIDEVRG